jgi:hypothetical protein
MPDIEKSSVEVESPVDNFEALQHRAAEAVMNANADPSLLTPKEHEDVAALQALAGQAAIEANLVLLSSPRESQ